MDLSETISIIKDSFESWYNKNICPDNPVSVLINYSDVQKMSFKAFHTTTYEVHTLGVENENTVITPLITLSENYNHGTTSEEEAKIGLTKKLLMMLYSFKA